MPILTPIKHWFQKRFAALGLSAVASEQRAKYNALLGADPDRLIAAITAFDAGSLGTLARMIEAYELRDDKMKTGSMKMKAAVARCDYSVMPIEGFEKDARAGRHVECLKRFWSSVRATDAFKRNERGGFALLAKQMMDAQSYGFAVHELVWTPLASGELGCTFVKVPLWHFENHTGELRFLARANDYEGSPMREGEWLVSTGDGVGIAAALCACIKRMSLADWLVFSERCGMPLLHGTTGAAFGSEQWNNLNAALAAIGRDTRVLTDQNSKIEAIPLGGGASTPFPPLVEWADRAIAALYRGADLSTMSRGDDAVGASVQEGETSLLEQDACNRLSDALHEQIDRFVIRYVFGEEPLARIWIEPISKPDVDTDIKVDEHLARLGVKLSKREALQRYGRTEAENENDALELRETPPQGGFAGFANERPPETPLQTARKPLQNAPSKPDGQGEGQDGGALLGPFLRALADDCKPLAGEVEELLKELESGGPRSRAAEKAKELLAKLPKMVPSDPTLAPLLAEEWAKAYGEAWDKSHAEAQSRGEGLANEITNPCPKCHRQMSEDGTCSFCEAGAKKTPADTADNADASGNPDATGATTEAEPQKPIYAEEHFKKIGQQGSAESLGLPDFKDVEPDPLPPETDPVDARRRLGEGIHVTTPLGKELELNLETTNHHLQHKKTKEDYDERIQHLDAAIETFQNPHEIWLDESTGRNLYVRLMKAKDGRKVVNAVDKSAKGWSWHVKHDYFDGYRHGKLLYLRGKNEAQG